MAEPTQDWAAEPAPSGLPAAPVAGAPAPGAAPGVPAAAAPAGGFDDWANTAPTKDWSDTAPGSEQWGGGATENWS